MAWPVPGRTCCALRKENDDMRLYGTHLILTDLKCVTFPGLNDLLRMLLALCATAILVGCGRRSNVVTNQAVVSSESRPAPRLAIRSMAELRQLLPPGLMTNEISARLGQPDGTKEAANGTAEWTYSLSPFPADNTLPGPMFMR